MGSFKIPGPPDFIGPFEETVTYSSSSDDRTRRGTITGKISDPDAKLTPGIIGELPEAPSS